MTKNEGFITQSQSVFLMSDKEQLTIFMKYKHELVGYLLAMNSDGQSCYKSDKILGEIKMMEIKVKSILNKVSSYKLK